MRAVIFHTALRPLILADYWLRSKGLKPDRFYWADRIACSWGYFV